MGDLARVNRLPATSFQCDNPPDPLKTVLSDYVMDNLNDKDRHELANHRQRAFEFGKSFYKRMSVEGIDG